MRSKNFYANGFALQESRPRDFEAAPSNIPDSGISSILSNDTRASILHLLASTPATLYSMQVEELASSIGTRPRLIIYHLEKLKSWGLVEVKKTRKYGSKERRSIWGLDMKNADWVQRCCRVLDQFFEENRLRAFVPGSKSNSRKATSVAARI